MDRPEFTKVYTCKICNTNYDYFSHYHHLASLKHLEQLKKIIN